MSPTLLSTLALLFVSFTHNANAGWRLEGCNLITARMDPLVSPNGIASHVHNIVGGSRFSATYDFNALRQSKCSSIEIQEDKSNYWAPPLYYKHRNDGTFSLVPSETGVYYFHRGTNIQQFPAGFRMIAGTASRGAMGSTPADRATFFTCLNQEETNPLTYELPKRQCEKGVMMRILFPSCWNGRDVTSANSKDHVSYPVGSPEGDTCPDTHPVRLMTLKFEQIFRTEPFEYYEGGFVVSTGDDVGYSAHADFQNGWDASQKSLLQQAINTCTDTGNHIQNCPVLNPLRNFDRCLCRPESQIPVEDVGFYGPLKKLPGDNPIWGGNVAKVLTGVSDNPPYGSPFTTLPSNWVEYGCVTEDNFGPNVMIGDHLVEDSMYPGRCVDNCNKKGFNLAGLEAGKICYCGNTNGGNLNTVEKRQCDSVCGGSRYEFCGASGKLNVYKKTG